MTYSEDGLSPMPGARASIETEAQRAYWNDRLRNNWGPHGVGTLVYGRYYNAWLYRVRKNVFRRVISRLDIDLSKSSVLDIGCGNGFYINQWKKLGAVRLTGVDISDVSINRLSGEFPEVNLYRLDISEDIRPLTRGTFDIVSAFDVLFHIVNDDRYREALRNIHLLLRDGGYFLFSDNFLHGEGKRYMDYWKSRPLSFIKTELEKTGFRVMLRTPMFVLMNPPVDTKYSIAERYWVKAMFPVRRIKLLGFFIGGLMYPIELLLIRLMQESPSTEIMICKKERIRD
jgi:SAM-dependent methyltransferase